jgi:gamma-glutamyltranspeptidase
MQWLPDQIDYEPGALDDSTMAALRDMGYSFKRITYWGSAQAITIDTQAGMLYGGTDHRHPAGLAAGY